MLAKRILITVWFCLVAAVALPAQEGGVVGGEQGVGHAAPGHDDQGDAGGDHGHHGPRHTMEMTASDIFKWQFDHSVTYPTDLLRVYEDDEEHRNGLFTIWNIHPWQWVCLGLMLLIFTPVVGSFKKGQVGWLTRVMRGFCLWVRDEMVYSVMGKEEGRKYAPFFMFMFFFV